MNTLQSNHAVLPKPDHFDSLFSANATEVRNSKALENLANYAKDGDQNSIDMLFNVALRNDEAGKKAEDILFDLFSGKTADSRPGVADDIMQASQKLYEAFSKADPNKGFAQTKKLKEPSPLLYMAGASATLSKDLKNDINQVFAKASGVAQSPYESLNEAAIWDKGRLITHDEIAAAARTIESASHQARSISLNAPMGLVQPDTGDNLLADVLSEKILNNNPDGFAKLECFPINTGNHWVLFGIDSSKKEAFIFSSSPLQESIRVTLNQAAVIAGVDPKKIEYVEKDLQSNVPNGCGLFVREAMKRLANHQDDSKSPAQVLNNFAQEFSTTSAEDQTRFNIESRRQSYGEYLRGVR